MKNKDYLRLIQYYNNGIAKINKFLRYINQPSKFKTKTWVDINHKSQGKYEKVNQIIFKTSLLRSSLCD